MPKVCKAVVVHRGTYFVHYTAHMLNESVSFMENILVDPKLLTGSVYKKRGRKGGEKENKGNESSEWMCLRLLMRKYAVHRGNPLAFIFIANIVLLQNNTKEEYKTERFFFFFILKLWHL